MEFIEFWVAGKARLSECWESKGFARFRQAPAGIVFQFPTQLSRS